jgi:hypothetical protein
VELIQVSGRGGRVHRGQAYREKHETAQAVGTTGSSDSPATSDPATTDENRDRKETPCFLMLEGARVYLPGPDATLDEAL